MKGVQAPIDNLIQNNVLALSHWVPIQWNSLHYKEYNLGDMD